MFALIFSDTSVFKGSSIPKSQWLEAPEKEVMAMSFKVGEKVFILEGFEEYNHLIEHVALQMQGFSKVLIMGRNGEETFILTVDFIEKKIYHNITEKGHEYGNQIISGWKKGIVLGDCRVYEKVGEKIKIIYPIK